MTGAQNARRQDRDDQQRWLTTREAARMLGVSERHVRRMAAAGRLKAWRVAGEGRWRVMLDRSERDERPCHDERNNQAFA